MSLRLARGDSEDPSVDEDLDLHGLAQLDDWKGGVMFWTPQDPAENAADFESGNLESWLNTSVIPAESGPANGLIEQPQPARPASEVHGSFMLPDPSAAISPISNPPLQACP